MIRFTRRTLLLGAAAAFAGGLAIAMPSASSAVDTVPYTPAVLAAAKASGKPFLVDFFADWCTTCHAQDRVIGELIAANPAYGTIPIIRVDWDKEERGELVRAMQIPRRSTLVVLRGDSELGRLVAATGRNEIAALLDLAL